jgi:glutamate-1-semialdehyde 2,1-aminomutase
MVAPAGPVYQAGTFSGNPLTIAAGKAAVGYLRENTEIYGKLEENIRTIKETLPEKYRSKFVSVGSMFKLFFRDTPPQNYIEAKESDTEAFSSFWKKMLKAGIFLPPAQFETNFISTAHSDADIEIIAGAYSECL